MKKKSTVLQTAIIGIICLIQLGCQLGNDLALSSSDETKVIESSINSQDNSKIDGTTEQEKNLQSTVTDNYETYKKLMVTQFGSGYLVEGDIFFSNEESIKAYYYSIQEEQLAQRSTGHLINGQRDSWNATERLALTYQISGFSTARTTTVRGFMNTSTQNWEQRADVNFIENTSGAAVFTVRPATALENSNNPSTIASAFFPHEYTRVLILFDLFFTYSVAQQEKVLQHELGHILGLRHEQYWFYGILEGSIKLLTEPDTASIMYSTFAINDPNYRYTGNLQISRLDAKGVRLLYGPPRGYVNNSDWYTSSCITDLHIIIGSSSSIQPPIGFIKIGVDLNKGASGKYIYLCYTRWASKSATIAGSQEYLKNITAAAYSSETLNAPTGWFHVIDTGGRRLRPDLNEGSGGKWVYLYQQYQSGSTLNCIKNIDVIYGSSSGIYRSGWNKVNVDLNAGAGGAYIYAIYQK